jgi:hypothetical protein
MERAVQALVEEVAGWRPSAERALHQCAAARDQLLDKLRHLGITDVQSIEVSGPIGSTRPHPDLHPAHQVLRIGTEVVDVTWAQIDTAADKPWKLYPSIEALRHDWAHVRDWESREPI